MCCFQGLHVLIRLGTSAGTLEFEVLYHVREKMEGLVFWISGASQTTNNVWRLNHGGLRDEHDPHGLTNMIRDYMEVS